MKKSNIVRSLLTALVLFMLPPLFAGLEVPTNPLYSDQIPTFGSTYINKEAGYQLDMLAHDVQGPRAFIAYTNTPENFDFGDFELSTCSDTAMRLYFAHWDQLETPDSIDIFPSLTSFQTTVSENCDDDEWTARVVSIDMEGSRDNSTDEVVIVVAVNYSHQTALGVASVYRIYLFSASPTLSDPTVWELSNSPVMYLQRDGSSDQNQVEITDVGIAWAGQQDDYYIYWTESTIINTLGQDYEELVLYRKGWSVSGGSSALGIETGTNPSYRSSGLLLNNKRINNGQLDVVYDYVGDVEITYLAVDAFDPFFTEDRRIIRLYEVDNTEAVFSSALKSRGSILHATNPSVQFYPETFNTDSTLPWGEAPGDYTKSYFRHDLETSAGLCMGCTSVTGVENDFAVAFETRFLDPNTGHTRYREEIGLLRFGNSDQVSNQMVILTKDGDAHDPVLTTYNMASEDKTTEIVAWRTWTTAGNEIHPEHQYSARNGPFSDPRAKLGFVNNYGSAPSITEIDLARHVPSHNGRTFHNAYPHVVAEPVEPSEREVRDMGPDDVPSGMYTAWMGAPDEDNDGLLEFTYGRRTSYSPFLTVNQQKAEQVFIKRDGTCSSSTETAWLNHAGNTSLVYDDICNNSNGVFIKHDGLTEYYFNNWDYEDQVVRTSVKVEEVSQSGLANVDLKMTYAITTGFGTSSVTDDNIRDESSIYKVVNDTSGVTLSFPDLSDGIDEGVAPNTSGAQNAQNFYWNYWNLFPAKYNYVGFHLDGPINQQGYFTYKGANDQSIKYDYIPWILE